MHDIYSAEMAHAHNNANFIAFGGRIKYHDPLEKILDSFINAKFDLDGRHKDRIKMIKELENKK